jgi:hypothetical protein
MVAPPSARAAPVAGPRLRGRSSTPPPTLRFASSSKTKKAQLIIAIGALCAALIQLPLGANIGVVMLALFGIGCGLAGFARADGYNMGAWVCFLFALGNILVALYAKTLVGQPIDSNLDAPFESFLVLDVGCLALVFSFLVARRLNVGAPILRATENPGTLLTLSWGSFAMGSVFWLLNRLAQDPEQGSGFGGWALFVNLFLMAIIARTAYRRIAKPDGRKLDAVLIVMIVVGIVTGVLDNAKTASALPPLSFFATLLFFEGSLEKRWLAATAIGGLLFATVLAPVTHIYRSLDIQDLSLRDRIDLVETESARMLKGSTFAEYGQLASEAFEGGYYDYFGHGQGQMLVGRYASIQQVDPVIDAIDESGPLGGDILWPAIGRSLPKVLNPNKPEDMEAFTILFRLGLIGKGAGKYPTVPLIAQSYAAYGMVGVLLIPLGTFLVFMLSLKKVSWDLRRNVFSIFFFCQFCIVYVNQGDFSQYTGMVLRGFPVFVVVFVMLQRIHRLASARSWRRAPIFRKVPETR